MHIVFMLYLWFVSEWNTLLLADDIENIKKPEPFFAKPCQYQVHNEAWLENDRDPLRVSAEVNYQMGTFLSKLRVLDSQSSSVEYYV